MNIDQFFNFKKNRLSMKINQFLKREVIHKNRQVFYFQNE
jgi:hypothetical protein